MYVPVNPYHFLKKHHKRCTLVCTALVGNLAGLPTPSASNWLTAAPNMGEAFPLTNSA